MYITVKNTLVYDHVGNTYHLSELTELSEGRMQFANKLDYELKSLLQDLKMIDVLRINWIKQGAEFLQQIVSFLLEESLPQIVSSIYEPNAIFKDLSEQDTCLVSKDLIGSERNAVDLNYQSDSKEQVTFTSFNIWNILDKIFVPIHVQPHALSAIQQLQRYAIVFRNVLASYRISAVEEATYN